MARYQRANALYRAGRFREAANDAQRIHDSGVEIGDDQAAAAKLLDVRLDPQSLHTGGESKSATLRGLLGLGADLPDRQLDIVGEQSDRPGLAQALALELEG